MTAIREFGKMVRGKDYVLRPGGYGVVRGAAGLFAVVVTSHGAFLLGGGQKSSETPRQALIREAREECGCTLRIGGHIAVADEMIFAKKEKTYFRKRCTFFAAEIVAHDPLLATEPGHTLVWLPLEEALCRLVHESHRWAIQSGVHQSKKRPDKSLRPTAKARVTRDGFGFSAALVAFVAGVFGGCG